LPRASGVGWEEKAALVRGGRRLSDGLDSMTDGDVFCLA
jgi:hypothetical protein